MLLARAAEARDVLPERLREAGAEVDVVALYDTVRESFRTTLLAKVAEADYVTFTSSSTVRYFVEAVGGADRVAGGRASLVSIGPDHERHRARPRAGVDVEAGRHDIDGLVDALVADAPSRPA